MVSGTLWTGYPYLFLSACSIFAKFAPRSGSLSSSDDPMKVSDEMVEMLSIRSIKSFLMIEPLVSTYCCPSFPVSTLFQNNIAPVAPINALGKSGKRNRAALNLFPNSDGDRGSTANSSRERLEMLISPMAAHRPCSILSELTERYVLGCVFHLLPLYFVDIEAGYWRKLERISVYKININGKKKQTRIFETF